MDADLAKSEVEAGANIRHMHDENDEARRLDAGLQQLDEIGVGIDDGNYRQPASHPLSNLSWLRSPHAGGHCLRVLIVLGVLRIRQAEHLGVVYRHPPRSNSHQPRH